MVAVPSGLLAGGWFRFRPGDRLLAVSSSGEFRDLVEAVEAGSVPLPYAAVTATAGSTIERAAGARALQPVLNQRAVTHTQALAGGVAAALAVWAQISDDAELAPAVAGLPDALARAVEAAEAWAPGLEPAPAPAAAVAFSAGPGWAAALEAALLLKEVAGVPAEGVDAREGATSAMYALGASHLAVSLPVGDPSEPEAERACADDGCAGRTLSGRRRGRSAPRARDDAAVRVRARGYPGRRRRPRHRPASLGGRLLPHGPPGLDIGRRLKQALGDRRRDDRRQHHHGQEERELRPVNDARLEPIEGGDRAERQPG